MPSKHSITDLCQKSGMKCISFETFWRQLSQLSSGDYQEAVFEATARKYLNINPEGELLRETHDIIEEVRMMAHIFTEQLHVVEQFSTHLQNLHDKESEKETAEKKMLDVMVEVKKLLERFTSSRGESSKQVINDATLANSSAAQSFSIAESQGSAGNSTAAPTSAEASDASCQTTVSTSNVTIPESTLHLAKDVNRDILQRRSELQKLDESTVYVSEQVRSLSLFSSPFPRSQLLLLQAICLQYSRAAKRSP